MLSYFRTKINFAIPVADGQMVSDRWLSGLRADRDYRDNEALSECVRDAVPTERELLFLYIRKVRRLLNDAKLFLGHDIRVELSVHKGIRNFGEYGCVLVECINDDEYTKKVIVQLPGQWNPSHYHKKKTETFHVLHGELIAEIDKERYHLPRGGKQRIPRGVAHAFGTTTGVIFEEISTKEFPGDSYYIDPKIAGKPRPERKIVLDYWGQYQYEEL